LMQSEVMHLTYRDGAFSKALLHLEVDAATSSQIDKARTAVRPVRKGVVPKIKSITSLYA
jgi:hypothetical protein